MPFKFAAESVGITESCFYEWMSRGEQEKTGKYAEFFEYIKSCQADAIESNIKLIKRAANAGTWPASAWLLERRFPEHFGRREKIDLDAKAKLEGGGAVVIYIPENNRDPDYQEEGTQ
jgi:transposase